MVSAYGEVLVLDWGVAGRLDTAATTAAGTEGYMAPEQRSGITDERTDIYSLGRVLHYLAAPGEPKALAAIVAKASHAEPALRYRRVGDLAEDLTRFLDGEPVGAYRETLLERAARQIGKHRTLVSLIVTYLLVRSAIFFFTRR